MLNVFIKVVNKDQSYDQQNDIIIICLKFIFSINSFFANNIL